MNFLRSKIVCSLATLVVSWCGTSWAQWPVGTVSPIKLQTVSNRPWKTIARSVQSRPLEVASFGQSNRNVLIVGPLAGNEPAALGLMDKLAEALKENATANTPFTAVVLRDPNPDGRVLRTRANARGVDLDTNFPSANWQKRPTGRRWLSGPQAASEPESRAILNLLAQTRPQWILILAAHDGPTRVDWSGPAQAMAEQLKQSAAVGQDVGEQLQGSLLSFMGHDRHIPTLLLTINNQQSAQVAWEAHGQALLALLGLQGSQLHTTAYANPNNYNGSSLPPSVPFTSNAPASPKTHTVSHNASPNELPSQTPAASAETQPSEKLPKVRILGASSLSPWKEMVRVELPPASQELPPLEHPSKLTTGSSSSSVFWPAQRIERLPPVWQQGE